MKKRKELNFHFSYFIYEIQTLAYKLLKNSSKTNLKLKEFLNINYEIEKVHKTASSLCQNFEKVMYFKALKNSNAKLLFTCEDVLYPIIEFGHQKNILSKIIKQYYKEQLLGKNSELKYILYYYCKLFNISYDTQIMNELYKGKELFPFFSEIEEELTNKTIINENFMILFFNCENKFVIYFSTRITELLDFGNEDLLGNDLNDLLLPKSISPFHSILMKQFLMLGNSSYKKKSFLLNKESQLIPFNIQCKILANFNTLFSLIFSVGEIETYQYKHYHVILDSLFYYMVLSKSFESHFFFSIKMLNSFKLSFCDFFCINKEQILSFFQSEKFQVYKNKHIPLSFSVNPEEHPFYEQLDFSMLINKPPEKELKITVGKEQILK